MLPFTHNFFGTLRERRWRDRHSPKRDRWCVTTESTATPPRPSWWTGSRHHCINGLHTLQRSERIAQL